MKLVGKATVRVNGVVIAECCDVSITVGVPEFSREIAEMLMDCDDEPVEVICVLKREEPGIARTPVKFEVVDPKDE